MARELLARGEDVKVLTRSAEKAGSLPEGVTAVIGDLRDPGCYHSVFSRFDTLFLLNAVAETELQEGLAAIIQARRAGAARIVYLSVHDGAMPRAEPWYASVPPPFSPSEEAFKLSYPVESGIEDADLVGRRDCL